MDLIDALVAAGCNLEAVESTENMTPLLYASDDEGDLDVVLALLQRGANSSAVDQIGRSALLVSLISDRPDIALALINAEADPNIVDNNGNTALSLAVDKRMTECSLALLKAGANPNLKVPLPPLVDAAATSSPELVTALLAAGANVNAAATLTGTTALIAAAAIGDAATVSQLLAAGANANARVRGGRTALLAAVGASSDSDALGCVAALMAAGADPSVTIDGLTAAELARRDGQEALAAACEGNSTESSTIEGK